MTAHFIGRFQRPDQTVETHALEAGEHVTCAPFEMALDRAYSFPRDRGEAPGIFAPSTPPGALLSLAARLRDATAETENAPRKGVAFRPHVTWIYSRDRIAETAIERIAWRVAELALAPTVPGQQRYEILRRWPLLGKSQ
jgi:2'-5' RNA ligase